MASCEDELRVSVPSVVAEDPFIASCEDELRESAASVLLRVALIARFDEEDTTSPDSVKLTEPLMPLSSSDATGLDPTGKNPVI